MTQSHIHDINMIILINLCSSSIFLIREKANRHKSTAGQEARGAKEYMSWRFDNAPFSFPPCVL